MKNTTFDVRLLETHWVFADDDREDLCAHGHVFVRIGDEVVADENSLDVTVSSTALYLSRTLSSNYKKDDYASQLLPCCGHVFMVGENDGILYPVGCPNGIDWTIEHIGDNEIKHTSARGSQAIIEFDEYKKMVLSFSDQVEQFYRISEPKILPTEDFERKGYLAFWDEWKNLRVLYG